MKGDRDAVNDLSPIAPPCFPTRTIWVEYCTASLVTQRRDDSFVGPFVLLEGRPVEFNPAFSFCTDCDACYSLAMQKRGRCNPAHLTDLLE